jgi:hypothetical protein
LHNFSPLAPTLIYEHEGGGRGRYYENIFLSPPMYMKMVVGGDIIYEDGGVGRYYAVVILCNFNKYFMDKLSDCKLENVVIFFFAISRNILWLN